MRGSTLSSLLVCVLVVGNVGLQISVSLDHRENFAVSDDDDVPVVRVRRTSGWSAEADEKSDGGWDDTWGEEDDEKEQEETNKPDKKSFVQRMGPIAAVPVCLIGAILLLVCFYKCCIEKGCCQCITLLCCCKSPKEMGRSVAGKYVPGVRTDETGRMYCDELTEEEVEASTELADTLGLTG